MTVLYSRMMIIPVIDDVKKHIWLWIFIFILNIAITLLILLLMTLLHNLCTVCAVLKYIFSIWSEAIYLHTGLLPASVNHLPNIFHMFLFNNTVPVHRVSLI